MVECFAWKVHPNCYRYVPTMTWEGYMSHSESFRSGCIRRHMVAFNLSFLLASMVVLTSLTADHPIRSINRTMDSAKTQCLLSNRAQVCRWRYTKVKNPLHCDNVAGIRWRCSINSPSKRPRPTIKHLDEALASKVWWNLGTKSMYILFLTMRCCHKDSIWSDVLYQNQ